MLWGGCLCIRDQEPEEGEKPWFPDIKLSNTSISKSFSHKQFAELTLINNASTELHSEITNDREMFFSPNLELIFYDPPNKSVPFLSVLRTNRQKKSSGETQTPKTRPSVIWQAPPSPSITANESVVSCLPTLDQHSEVYSEEELELSQADSDIVSVLANSERAHSVILTPCPIAINADILPTCESLNNVDTKGMRTACSRSSYLEWGERESRMATESSSNYTIAARFDSSDCLEYEDAESTFTSLYPTEEEESLGDEQECVWATFTPLTPKGRDSSMSSSAMTSSRTSQRGYTTWESYPKDELHIQKKNSAPKVEINGRDSINESVHWVIV